MRLALQEIAAAIGAAPPANDAVATGFSTDTRTLQPGDVFFALKGPNHDGNRYVSTAFSKGALAAVAEMEGVGILTVPDALSALQKVAAFARTRWGGVVVGITGSAGKTTTKDIVARMLASALPTGKTMGNFNNHVGVPLSILGIPGEARVAVIEIGMNHAGEIRDLSTIAQQTIALVTNVGYAHVENFPDGIEGIARAKRELVEALPAGGLAILNLDDHRVAQFAAAHPGPTLTFGLSEGADYRATDVREAGPGMWFRACGVEFHSPLAGLHNVRNVLAGLAVAGHFGIEPEALRDVAAALAPGKMRGERLVRNGITIYDDCYNANPEAMRAMLDVLRGTPARRHIAVLGEMLELGRLAESLHRDVGSYAARVGIPVLVGIRGAARYAVDAAIAEGVETDAAYFFDEPEPAGDKLKEIAREGDAILFKGSRGTQVERALERFLG
ncbi:MAG TPA: UDP-N-acetylmuramoyl-tripeptide--D-alanyl-D-alanine ligase [Solibacterales bacterium]|nr:UDP-N-acetylmuramoyl-tripeptide--D-alanyl-D-alanine ligase [Bryobacterales bacterium]